MAHLAERSTAGILVAVFACALAACGSDSTTTVITEVTTTQEISTTNDGSGKRGSSRGDEEKNQPRGLSLSSPLSTQGLGSVLAGMSLAKASENAGSRLVPKEGGSTDTACSYYELKKLPEGISFMVSDGEIARVDVLNPSIATLSGIHVGDSEDSLRAAYGSNLTSEANYYNPDWTDYSFIPDDQSDKTRMIFQVDDKGEIVSIRSGRLPEVGYVEGCS